MKIGVIFETLLREGLEKKIVLKSKSDKGNRYFDMLKTGMFQHYDSPKGELSTFNKGEEDRKRLVSNLSKEDKERYKEWLKTPDGEKSLEIFNGNCSSCGSNKTEELNESKKKSELEKLEDNKIPLTDDERKKVMDADAVWHFSPSNKPSPAVWKSKNPKTGKITYITNSHRAYNTATTLKGAITRFHDFIKGTS